MGLIMLGTASERVVEEMLSYARETQHEKIIRSLAVGIALVHYGTRELADNVINELTQEKVRFCLGQLYVMLIESGCYSAIRSHVHYRPRLRRYRQQQSRSKAAARRGVRRLG